jgi:hypothetical protein
MTAISKISGQMEGLDISIQSMSRPSNTAPNTTILDDLRREFSGLRQCLRVSESAVSAAPQRIKASIEKMESLDEANLIASVTKGRPGLVTSAIARNQSRMLILDSLSEDGQSGLAGQLFHPRA